MRPRFFNHLSMILPQPDSSRFFNLHLFDNYISISFPCSGLFYFQLYSAQLVFNLNKLLLYNCMMVQVFIARVSEVGFNALAIYPLAGQGNAQWWLHMKISCVNFYDSVLHICLPIIELNVADSGAMVNAILPQYLGIPKANVVNSFTCFLKRISNWLLKIKINVFQNFVIF
jgi:hypothetical protein